MTALPGGPWCKLTLVGLRLIRPTDLGSPSGDDPAIDDPLGGWCLEAHVESGGSFRRLPPRGLTPKPDDRSLLPMLASLGLGAFGVWKLWELAAMAVVALLR